MPDLSNVKNLGTILKDARTGALPDLATQLRVAIAGVAQLNIDAFQENVGKLSASTYALHGVNDKSKMGFSLWPIKHSKGVSATIKEAALRIDTAGTYTVHVVRIYPTIEVVDDFEITSVANAASYNDNVDIALPMHHRGEPAQYAIYWEPVGQEKPFNIETICGCTDDPQWHKNALMGTSGFRVDNVSDIATDKTGSDKNTYGLSLTMEFDCDPIGFLCGVPDSFWQTNHIGTTMAKCLQLMSVRRVISKLLSTNQPNANNILSRESMTLNRHKLKSITTGLIKWLAVEIATNPAMLNRTDCIHCKPSMGMQKRSKRI